MDRKSWFIDFAKIAGRKNLHAYAIGVFRNILGCDYNNVDVKVQEIQNALEGLDEAFCNESLPWDVIDAKKTPTAMEVPKEISQANYTTNGWAMKGILRSEGCA